MIKRYFRINRKYIAPVQFIIEGYGEMATVTTIDSRAAILQVSIIPDFLSDMNGLLEDLKIKYNMREIDDYPVK